MRNYRDPSAEAYLKYRNTEKEARSRELKAKRDIRLEEMRIAHAQAFGIGLFGDVNQTHRAAAIESAKHQRKWKLSW
jgi:molybdenum cofactor biosynthesis enzyme